MSGGGQGHACSENTGEDYHTRVGGGSGACLF